MLRVSPGLPLLLCWTLTGCLSVDALPFRSGRSAAEQTLPTASEFNLQDPAERREAFAEVLRQEIIQTRRGSLVNLVDDDDRRYLGTVLSVSPTRVELIDCLCKDIIPGPDDERQQRTSFRPFQSLNTSKMTHYSVLGPPTPDFDARRQAADSRKFIVEAVVLKSGRRQHCCTLFEPAPPVARATPIDDLREQFASTPRGSQIRLVDQSGRRWQATFLSLEEGRIELMNCLSVESATAPDGTTASTLHHVPLETHALESLARFEFVTPPPGKFATTDADLDRAEYCVESFLDQHGQLHHWGQPHPQGEATTHHSKSDTR